MAAPSNTEARACTAPASTHPASSRDKIRNESSRYVERRRTAKESRRDGHEERDLVNTVELVDEVEEAGKSCRFIHISQDDLYSVDVMRGIDQLQARNESDDVHGSVLFRELDQCALAQFRS